MKITYSATLTDDPGREQRNAAWMRMLGSMSTVYAGTANPNAVARRRARNRVARRSRRINRLAGQ